METITVTLPKKTSLTKRISQASEQIREWLKKLDIVYNDERDKLQLSGCESKNDVYLYRYSIIKREPISAFKAKGRMEDIESTV
ncbi:MAG: hypothetical protein JW932_09945 [Deltaproteobacteria bacterium]|nr:hypothetical protein [Deltaproteobacteria bacterium]